MNKTNRTTEIEGVDANTYAGKAIRAVKTKARGILGDDLLTFTLLDFVSLMILNNKFAENGIFITGSNREECYIKIIELGNDSLIDDLEKYINLLDSILEIQHKKDEYYSIIDSIKVSTSDEDINSAVKDYLQR
jgi:hypothetical protein